MVTIVKTTDLKTGAGMMVLKRTPQENHFRASLRL